MVGPEVAPPQPKEALSQEAVVFLELEIQLGAVLFRFEVDRPVAHEEVDVGQYELVQRGRNRGCDRFFMFSDKGQDLVHETKVMVLQNLVAGLNIGVQMILIVEGPAVAHDVGANEDRRRGPERVRAAKESIAAYCWARDE